MSRVVLMQVAWFALSAVWNATGAGLVLSGRRALGPKASFVAAAMLAILGSALAYSAGRIPLVYLALSAVAGWAALMAIVNAFRADPSLWPSDSWRYAGVAINAVGVSGAALALASALGGAA